MFENPIPSAETEKPRPKPPSVVMAAMAGLPPPPPVPRVAPAPLPVPRAAAVGIAVLSSAAIGGILTTLAHEPSPVVAVPAILFGVVAATAPALYIATVAASGPQGAPTLAVMVRAFGVALGAFGIALAGLVLPTAFLALSSLSNATTIVVTTAAIVGAGVIGIRRLAAELTAGIVPTLARGVVFCAWACAVLGIAGRLWVELAHEVLS